jgi:hypothetical protein
MYTSTETQVRELDRRTNDGFDVRLVWDPHTDRIFVAVDDEPHGDSFTFEAEPADALQAFRHPFAYSPEGHDPVSQSAQHLRAGQPQLKERS